MLPVCFSNSSCGKVMFSQACVKNSVQRGVCMAGVCVHAWGACVARGGACMAGGCSWWGGHVWQGGHAWWGWGGVHSRGHAWQGDMHGRRDGHCSERYASYWNAFLFKAVLTIVVNYVFAIEFSRIYTKLPMLGLNDYMGYSKNI